MTWEPKRSKSSKILRILPEKDNGEGRPAGRAVRGAAEKRKKHANKVSHNLKAARSGFGVGSHVSALKNLRGLTKKHHLSVSGGHLTLLGDQLLRHASLSLLLQAFGERSRFPEL